MNYAAQSWTGSVTEIPRLTHEVQGYAREVADSVSHLPRAGLARGHVEGHLAQARERVPAGVLVANVQIELH